MGRWPARPGLLDCSLMYQTGKMLVHRLPGAVKLLGGQRNNIVGVLFEVLQDEFPHPLAWSPQLFSHAAIASSMLSTDLPVYINLNDSLDGLHAEGAADSGSLTESHCFPCVAGVRLRGVV